MSNDSLDPRRIRPDSSTGNEVSSGNTDNNEVKRELETKTAEEERDVPSEPQADNVSEQALENTGGNRVMPLQSRSVYFREPHDTGTQDFSPNIQVVQDDEHLGGPSVNRHLSFNTPAVQQTTDVSNVAGKGGTESGGRIPNSRFSGGAVPNARRTLPRNVEWYNSPAYLAQRSYHNRPQDFSRGAVRKRLSQLVSGSDDRPSAVRRQFSTQEADPNSAGLSRVSPIPRLESSETARVEESELQRMQQEFDRNFSLSDPLPRVDFTPLVDKSENVSQGKHEVGAESARSDTRRGDILTQHGRPTLTRGQEVQSQQPTNSTFREQSKDDKLRVLVERMNSSLKEMDAHRRQFENLRQEFSLILDSNADAARSFQGDRNTAPQNPRGTVPSLPQHSVPVSHAPQPHFSEQRVDSQPVHAKTVNQDVVYSEQRGRRRGLQSRDTVLSEFSGAANESLEAWIKMAQWKQRSDSLTEEEIFSAAVFKLRGDALAYFHLSEDQFVGNRTLQQLLEVMREQYDALGGPEFAVPELTGTKQREGESTAAFETRFRTNAVRAERAAPGLVTDALLLHTFVSNVQQDFRQRLLEKKPKTFQEALKEFRWYGRFIKGEMTKTKLPGVFAVGAWHENKKQTGKISNVEVTRKASSEKTAHSLSHESPQRSTKGGEKGSFKGLCYVCSQPGHRASNCEFRTEQGEEQKHKKSQSYNSGQKGKSRKNQNFATGFQNQQQVAVQSMPFAQNIMAANQVPVFQYPQMSPCFVSPSQIPWYQHSSSGVPMMGVPPYVHGQNVMPNGLVYPGWGMGGSVVQQQQTPTTGGWQQFPPAPPQMQQSARIPESRRLQAPASVEKREEKSEKETKVQHARVHKVSARFPRLYIVKCDAKFGGTVLPVLVDSCAPCCLIDVDMLHNLKALGKARKTSYREYSHELILVGISGQKLETFEEMEVDFELGGAKVTRNFIPVRNFSDKVLLATDFCDDVEANLSFGTREVQLLKLGVTLPMVGYWRRVKGQLPKAVVFCKESTVIPPQSELPIEVVHLGSNSLSFVTREAYVCERSEALRPSSLRVCPAIVRFDRGVGTIVVANFGKDPVHLDRESAVADVLPIEEREKELQLSAGETMGVFRVQHVEDEFDLESDSVPTLASLAIKQKGLPSQESYVGGDASFQSF